MSQFLILVSTKKGTFFLARKNWNTRGGGIIKRRVA